MLRHAINRLCPVTGLEPVRVIGHIRAGWLGPANPTYRADYLDILGVSAEDEYPIVEGPTGFVFAGWLPDQAFLQVLYNQAVDHSRTTSGTVSYRQWLMEFGAGLLNLAQGRGTSGQLRLLDYGCGYGSFLKMLCARDILGVGYEPSLSRNEIAGLGGDAKILGDLEEVARHGPFDLIVCTEVLEHMIDPRSALRFIRANAAPGALLAITVPNCATEYVCSSLAAADAGAPLSMVFNPWEHLNYFSAASLRAMLEEEGFAVITDFGRTRSARFALDTIGSTSLAAVLRNGLRITKRMATLPPSTELLCQCV